MHKSSIRTVANVLARVVVPFFPREHERMITVKDSMHYLVDLVFFRGPLKYLNQLAL